MIEIDIPGYGLVHLEHLVLGFNGTLSVDGKILPRSATQNHRPGTDEKTVYQVSLRFLIPLKPSFSVLLQLYGSFLSVFQLIPISPLTDEG
jgi:hypothetical protein